MKPHEFRSIVRKGFDSLTSPLYTCPDGSVCPLGVAYGGGRPPILLAARCLGLSEDYCEGLVLGWERPPHWCSSTGALWDWNPASPSKESVKKDREVLATESKAFAAGFLFGKHLRTTYVRRNND